MFTVGQKVKAVKSVNMKFTSGQTAEVVAYTGKQLVVNIDGKTSPAVHIKTNAIFADFGGNWNQVSEMIVAESSLINA